MILLIIMILMLIIYMAIAVWLACLGEGKEPARNERIAYMKGYLIAVITIWLGFLAIDLLVWISELPFIIRACTL